MTRSSALEAAGAALRRRRDLELALRNNASALHKRQHPAALTPRPDSRSTMLDLTQARPAVTPGLRPIVAAPSLAAGYAALREVGIDPDNPRAYCAILTPISAPLSHVQGARPELHPLIDVLGDAEPGRYLRATLDYMRGRGWPVLERPGGVEDKTIRGPRERPKPKPAPAPAAPADELELGDLDELGAAA